MKRALSTILAVCMLLSVVLLAGCHKKPRRETGNIEVDYGRLVEDGGTIMYVKYEDDKPLTFMYPNYFTQSSDEGETFVAKGPDDNSVLMYEAGTLGENRTYDTITGYTDAEAQNWMLTIQLGLVESQGVDSIELDDYRFYKFEDHLCMIVDATATYSTGLIQKNSLTNFILPTGEIYTLHAFSPISAVNKYGPLFKDVLYDGCKVDEALPEGTGGAAYSAYDTGNVSFLYNDIFSITAKDGRGYSLVAEHFAMLAFEPSKLIGDHTYEELRDMPNGQLLEYLAGLTALTATVADLIENVEEDGHLRLETHYVSDQGERKINVVVVQFVFPDGSTQNVFAYSDDPEPIKNVTLND